MGGAYLRAFSERVADVPSYLKRHLALIRDLDEKVQALQKEIEVHSKRKLAAAKASEGGSKRQKQSEDTYDVEPAVTRLLSLADEKVTIAAQVYDFIDKHIQHLDEDLKALTVEIDAEKQQGPGVSGPGTRTTAAAGAAANGGGGARAPKRGSTGAAGSSKQGDGGGKEGKGGKPKTTKAGASNKPRTGGGRGVAVEAAPPGAVDAPPVLLAHGPGEHEPLYCYCQKPSHGNMVACDNDECRFEWFHYECVGLTEPPGDQEWYCPECLQLMSAKKAGASGRGGQAKK